MSGMNRHGFILIIVIGILGVLGMVAVQLSSASRTAAELSGDKLGAAQAHLWARSGIEIGVLKVQSEAVGSGPSSARSNGVKTDPSGEPHSVNWSYRDNATGINLNDGIDAGKLKLGSAYDAQAVDPWPSGVDDESALVNLRLRRLLNAYGEVHRYIDQIGWPNFRNSDPDGPNAGTPFTFTSTAAGDRYSAMPAKDVDGNDLTSKSDIADRSTGLGDRLIAARPQTGWNSLEDARGILDSWGTEHLSSSYLEARTFYEIVTGLGDFSVDAWTDKHFLRLKKEIGADNDGDGRADYLNDFTRSEPTDVPVLPGPCNSNMIRLDTQDPDLSDLWEWHPVSPINFNHVSDIVRAAILYAPVNVSYQAEGLHLLVNPTTNFFVVDYHPMDVQLTSELLGVAGPVFRPMQMTENGVSSSLNVQVNRLMSLRDAMIVSRGFANWSSTVGAWPDSFPAFAKALRDIRKTCKELERADGPLKQPYSLTYSSNSYLMNSDTGNPRLDAGYLLGKTFFDQQYLELTLPNIYSTIRRFPSWLHAPIALLSPYVNPSFDSGYEAKRSAEDFVFRWKEPKIVFQPTGHYEIRGDSRIERGPTKVYLKSISLICQPFVLKVLRTQAEFEDSTDSAHSENSPEFTFGPEPQGVDASQEMGVVGLRDVPTRLPSGSQYGIAMNFDGSLEPDAGSNFDPVDSNADPENIGGLVGWRESNLEDGTNSFFSDSGTDLSPFGGVSLSSRGHGHGSPGQQTDSLYFRPLQQFLGTSGFIGEHVAQGLVSMWVRVPSGFTFSRVNPSNTNDRVGRQHNIFQLAIWEHYRASTNGAASGPAQYKTKPTVIGACFNSARSPFLDDLWFVGKDPPLYHSGFQSSGNIHQIQAYYMTSRTGRQVYTSGFEAPNTTWPGFAGINELTAPTNEADYNTNPMYGMMVGPLRDAMRRSEGYAWVYPFSAPTLIPGVFCARNNLASMETLAPRLDSVYQMRPGSWVRVVLRWDFKERPVGINAIPMGDRLRAHLHDVEELGLHSEWDSGTETMTHREHPSFATTNGRDQPGQVVMRLDRGFFPPQMMFTFGEKPWMSSSAGHAFDTALGSSSLPGSYSRPADGVTCGVERLNSTIDNLVVMLGGFPHADYELQMGDGDDDVAVMAHLLSYPLDYRYPEHDSMKRMYDRSEAIPGFGSRRYNISASNEPSWIVNPDLPVGARLLRSGARVYDVPFLPHAGDPGGTRNQFDKTTSDKWLSWSNRAPRVEVTAFDQAGAFNPVTQNMAVEDHDIRLNSREWTGYDSAKSDGSVRIRVQYMSEDPDGQAIGAVLADIPWIKEINWSYIPPGALKVHRWIEN